MGIFKQQNVSKQELAEKSAAALVAQLTAAQQALGKLQAEHAAARAALTAAYIDADLDGKPDGQARLPALQAALADVAHKLERAEAVAGELRRRVDGNALTIWRATYEDRLARIRELEKAEPKQLETYKTAVVAAMRALKDLSEAQYEHGALLSKVSRHKARLGEPLPSLASIATGWPNFFGQGERWNDDTESQFLQWFEVFERENA